MYRDLKEHLLICHTVCFFEFLNRQSEIVKWSIYAIYNFVYFNLYFTKRSIYYIKIHEFDCDWNLIFLINNMCDEKYYFYFWYLSTHPLYSLILKCFKFLHTYMIIIFNNLYNNMIIIFKKWINDLIKWINDLFNFTKNVKR